MATGVIDYKTPCGVIPLSLIQMLASCIVVDQSGNTYLNTIKTDGACTAIDPLVDCNNAGQDMEAMLVENIFAVDECGNLAVKFYGNTGAGVQ